MQIFFYDCRPTVYKSTKIKKKLSENIALIGIILVNKFSKFLLISCMDCLILSLFINFTN